MKRFLAFAASLLLLAQVSSFAQMKVAAGYLDNSIKYSDSGINLSFNGSGFYAGVMTESPFSQDLQLEYGLLFDYISYSIMGEKSAIYYLRAPFHFRYDFEMGNDHKFFVNAGPGIVFGLGGEDDPFGDEGMNRFDVNLGAEAGFALTKALDFRLGYDWGLLRTTKEINSHKNGLHVGITYAF